MAVDGQREVGRLLVQPLPRRLLRADRLPHRVAEGQLPGRVHGRADLVGDGHQGQGAVLRQPGGEHGHRDPAAGRQRVRPRVHGRRRQHPLRARCGEGRRLRRGGGDQARPRGGRPVHEPVGLLRARRLPGRQQEGDRGADQVRRVRLHGRDAPRHARGAGGGAGRRPEGPARRADRPGLDLRPRRPRRRRHGLRRQRVRARPSADPDARVRAARAAGDGEGVDRPLHHRAPAQARARGAAR